MKINDIISCAVKRTVRWCVTIILIILPYTGHAEIARDILVKWTPPTQNNDGSTIMPITGYNIYYGLRTREYEGFFHVDGNVSQVVAHIKLPDGVVTAVWISVTVLGIYAYYPQKVGTQVVQLPEIRESDYSNEVIKAVTVGVGAPIHVIVE